MRRLPGNEFYGEKVYRAGGEDDHDAPRNVRYMVDAARDARPADEDGEHPKNHAPFSVEEPDDHRHGSREENMVGRETVVGRMGDQGDKMAGDERSRIIIEMSGDPRNEIRERRDDDATNHDALLNIARLPEKKDRADKESKKIKILGDKYDNGVHKFYGSMLSQIFYNESMWPQIKNYLIYFLTGGIFTVLIVALEENNLRLLSGFATLMPVFTLVAYVFIGESRGGGAVGEHAWFVLVGTIVSWVPYMIVVATLAPKFGARVAIALGLVTFFIFAAAYLAVVYHFRLFGES